MKRLFINEDYGFKLEIRFYRFNHSDNRTEFMYRLWDSEWSKDGEPIFKGCQFYAPPCEGYVERITEEHAESLLSFLSLQEGDVEDDYFVEHKYTKEQLRWRDKRAEELGMWALEMEERLHPDE